METVNPIIRYIFPIIMFLQYIGCDSHRSTSHYELNNSSRKTISVKEVNCSDLTKYTYNGFYSSDENGELLKKQDEYYIDSIRIAKKPLITFQDVKYVEKTYDNLAKPSILLSLNEKARLIFKEYTAKNVGNKIAIVVKDSLITAPVINSEIPGGKVEISASFTEQEVDELYSYLSQLKDCK